MRFASVAVAGIFIGLSGCSGVGPFSPHSQTPIPEDDPYVGAICGGVEEIVYIWSDQQGSSAWGNALVVQVATNSLVSVIGSMKTLAEGMDESITSEALEDLEGTDLQLTAMRPVDLARLAHEAQQGLEENIRVGSLDYASRPNAVDQLVQVCRGFQNRSDDAPTFSEERQQGNAR